MTAAPLARDEATRLRALHELALLDTLPEQVYDDLALLAAQICGTPIALMSMIDAERQWFKANVGLAATQTHRDFALCAHAILQPESAFVVEDAARDARFADNPLVTGEPHIRFYAGAPIVTASGQALGTVCVIDTAPRALVPAQAVALKALARQASALLELRLRTLTSEQQARVDTLTGLPNRRQLDERLEQALQRTQRSGQTTAVLYLDIDHFKQINDTLGHAVGDAVLCEFGRRLQAHVRATDVAARLAGDEFVVLIEGATAAVDAERVAQKIAAAMRPPFEIGAQVLAVSTSIGIASCDGSARGTADLLARADRAMYDAKKRDRGGCLRRAQGAMQQSFSFSP